MRLFGYACVSTSQQSLNNQVKAVQIVGVKLFTGKVMGRNTEDMIQQIKQFD